MTTTTTILPPPVALEYSEKMLSTPMPHLIHNLFAIPRTIPANSGNTLRMRRYNRLDTATVPVDPLFLNPPAQTLTALDIDAKINWYATQVIITREVTAVNEDPVLNQEAARLGQSLDVLGDFKPTLIDLEAYGESYGNRGEGASHAERLNEMAA